MSMRVVVVSLAVSGMRNDEISQGAPMAALSSDVRECGLSHRRVWAGERSDDLRIERPMAVRSERLE